MVVSEGRGLGTVLPGKKAVRSARGEIMAVANVPIETRGSRVVNQTR